MGYFLQLGAFVQNLVPLTYTVEIPSLIRTKPQAMHLHSMALTCVGVPSSAAHLCLFTRLLN